MMHIEEIDISRAENLDPARRFMEIYEQSFPENERRLYSDVKAFQEFAKCKRGLFRFIGAYDESGVLIGFMTIWDFRSLVAPQGYIYIEHFAVSESHRGSGIGALMLEYVKSQISGELLLEVEIPDDQEPSTLRRIAFYERMGFRKWEEVAYEQPAYSCSQQSVAMLLMTSGQVEKPCESMLGVLYHEVYNRV